MTFQARGSPLVMKVKGRVDFQRGRPPTWSTFLHKLARTNKVESNHRAIESVQFQTSYLGLLQPLYDQCKPCSIKYKAIVHMETFDQDSG